MSENPLLKERDEYKDPHRGGVGAIVVGTVGVAIIGATLYFAYGWFVDPVVEGAYRMEVSVDENDRTSTEARVARWFADSLTGWEVTFDAEASTYTFTGGGMAELAAATGQTISGDFEKDGRTLTVQPALSQEPWVFDVKPGATEMVLQDDDDNDKNEVKLVRIRAES